MRPGFVGLYYCMKFAPSACVMLMLFLFAGVVDGLAQGKAAKLKITTQPVSRMAELGQTVTFTVAHNSTTPVTFQWRLNKAILSGETFASLEIDGVGPWDAGKYDVVVTNAAGAVTSKAATLTINLAPPSLAVDDVIDGSFTMRLAGQTVAADGAFIVTGSNTLQDPESPTDTYTFTYKRAPKNKATLVINGRFYDSELGGYITSVETHSLTFTGVASDGRLIASDSVKGYMLPPLGYVQKKLGFTGSGYIALETSISDELASGSSLSGTLTVGGSTVINGPSGPGAGGTLTLGGSKSVADSGGGSGGGGSTPPTGSPGAISSGSVTISATTITLGSFNIVGIGQTGSSEPVFGLPQSGQINFIGSFSDSGGVLVFDLTDIAIGSFSSSLPVSSYSLPMSEWTGAIQELAPTN